MGCFAKDESRVYTSLVQENMSAGDYEVEFDGSNLPSGVYIYRIEAGVFEKSKKMVLLK